MPNDEHSPTQEGDVGASRLTYAQLAERLGISGDAARQLVRRRGWRRIMPNYPGAPAVIVVPEDELGAEQWRQDRGGTPPSDAGATLPCEAAPTPSYDISALEGAVASLTERAEAAETRADRAEARADQAIALAGRTVAQLADAQAALADERVRADQVRAQVDELRAQLAKLREDDAARQARGLLARLRDAWRGR